MIVKLLKWLFVPRLVVATRVVQDMTLYSDMYELDDSGIGLSREIDPGVSYWKVYNVQAKKVNCFGFSKWVSLKADDVPDSEFDKEAEDGMESIVDDEELMWAGGMPYMSDWSTENFLAAKHLALDYFAEHAPSWLSNYEVFRVTGV